MLMIAFGISPLAVYAEDDEEGLHVQSVEHAVISQTIAPDARGASMLISVWLLILMSTPSTGTLQSTPSASAVPVSP